MKRTLIRTWKILLLWLFVCYEIGSLLDYMFFLSLSLALSAVSWAVDIIIYILYDCIFCVFKNLFVCLFSCVTWFFLFSFHLLVLIFPVLIDFLSVYLGNLYFIIGREFVLTCSAVMWSLNFVLFDLFNGLGLFLKFF